MHISLLGQGLLQLLLRLGVPLPAAAVTVFLFLVLYCLLTGAAPSAVRAVCMFAVLLGAKLLLRTYDSLTALALAGILMLLENPCVLFSSGFQLSFSAVLAVSLVWPAVSWLLPAQIRKPGKIRKRAGADRAEKRALFRRGLTGWIRYFYRLFLRCGLFWLVMSLSMLPLTAWYYYEIPVWGLLPNLLLLPAAPVLLASGTAGILAGLLSPFLGRLVLLLPELLLQSFRLLTDGIRQLPLATLVCGKPGIFQVLGSELLLLLLTGFLHREKQRIRKRKGKEKKKEQRRTGILALTGAGVSMLILLFRWTPAWSLTMLDVGQGDCLVLRDRTACFLVDGGSSSVKEAGTYRILPYLKSQGITCLDGVLISHPDEDHVNGIRELFEAVRQKQATLRIRSLYLPLWMKGTEEEKEFREAAEHTGTAVCYLARGDTIASGLIRMEVLSPFYEGGIRSGNSGSLVLSVSCRDFDALLTGDLEQDGEALLLPLDRNYEYLKVGHHGSKGSSSEEFLRQCRPAASAVSAPAHSRYGHPHQETLERLEQAGAEIFITRDLGAVIAEGRGNSWRIYGYLQ